MIYVYEIWSALIQICVSVQVEEKPRLFAESEDSGADIESDTERFSLKPQFEGKLGQKVRNTEDTQYNELLQSKIKYTNGTVLLLQAYISLAV